MRETTLLRKIQVEVSKMGGRVFRNNVGVLKDAHGKRVRYGLCVGSADLIGWTVDGRFLAIEVKAAHGRLSRKQKAFLSAVNKAGGIGIVAWDEGNVMERLGGDI